MESLADVTAKKKLDYFENEVRRVEIKLAQQKVGYDRQLKAMQLELDEARNNAPTKKEEDLDEIAANYVE